MQKILKNIKKLLVAFSFYPISIVELKTKLVVREYKNGSLKVEKI